MHNLSSLLSALCRLKLWQHKGESASASIFHTVFLLWLLSLCIIIIIIIIIKDFTNDDDALMHIEEYTIMTIEGDYVTRFRCVVVKMAGDCMILHHASITLKGYHPPNDLCISLMHD